MYFLHSICKMHMLKSFGKCTVSGITNAYFIIHRIRLKSKYILKLFFYQQMHLLLNIKNVAIYINISYIRSYMFRFTWTILRELTLSLAKEEF
jgi:hypothetical protein